ncbi:MAG: SMC-Scp complex subunit ScpB [Nanoarchaeota archaeon]
MEKGPNTRVSSKTIDEIDEAKEIEDLKRLEAVFFISGKFLNMSELVSLSDLNPIIIRELIAKLKEKYENNNSAIEIVEKNGLWKMDVSQEYSDIVNKLATGSAEFTKAEQETLAIIAYKQPIKQSVIVKIRGNKSYDHIKKFYDLGLINKKKSGHTNELSLSEDFYDYFSVQEKDKKKEQETWEEKENIETKENIGKETENKREIKDEKSGEKEEAENEGTIIRNKKENLEDKNSGKKEEVEKKEIKNEKKGTETNL